MKFITDSDLNLILSRTLLNQALNDCSNIDLELSRAEDKALEEVKQWLTQKYDIDHELRAYSIFESGIEYNAGNRVFLTANTENKKYAQQRGIDIIFSAGNDTVLALKDNVCPLSTATTYYSEYYQQSIPTSLFNSNYNAPISYSTENPLYSAVCGTFSYKITDNATTITADEYHQWLSGGTIGTTIIDSTYSIDKKDNKYKTEYIQIQTGSTYNSSADTWSQLYSAQTIDFNYYSLVSGQTPLDFYSDANYFDNYLQSNVSNEWLDDRNATLIDIVASLTVYNLIRRVSPRMMSQTITDMHDLSLENLKLFNKGTKQINIRRRENQSGSQAGGNFLWGMNTTTQRNNY